MKTKADKIQEAAIRKYGMKRTMAGVRMSVMNPAAVAALVLLSIVIMAGASLIVNHQNARTAYIQQQEDDE